MEEKGMVVTKSEQFATYRQTIIPPTAEDVPQIMAALFELYKTYKITGPLVITFNMGGIRSFTADQIAKVPEGTPADIELEKLFGKIK